MELIDDRQKKLPRTDDCPRMSMSRAGLRIHGRPPAVCVVSSQLVHRDHISVAAPAPPDLRTHLSRLLRSERPPGHRAFHPFRAPHDRRGLRRPGQGADRAGPGIPPGRLLRRGARSSCARPILAAEDKNFFSHSGVDYRALPRVIQKTVVRSLTAWWKGGAGFRLLFPQGGSTLTQQLVRGYFLQDQTSQRGRRHPLPTTDSSRGSSLAVLGVPATNKLLRKLEEVRLSLWLEEEMRRRYGSQGAGQARDLRPLGQLPLPGQRPLRLRRRLRVLLRQAPVELHAGGRGQGRAARGDRQVAQGLRPGRR